MSKDAVDELERGRKAARTLVAHLRRMGADEAVFPVSANGREYEVTVKRLAMGKEPERPEK